MPTDAPAAAPLPPGAVPVSPHAATPPPPGVPLPPGMGTPIDGPAPAAAGGTEAPRLVERRVVSQELQTKTAEEMAEGDGRPFLELLPPEMLEGSSLPLAYRLITPTGYRGVTVRMAESDPARARMYPCMTFYKPVSRCVGGRE